MVLSVNVSDSLDCRKLLSISVSEFVCTKVQFEACYR